MYHIYYNNWGVNMLKSRNAKAYFNKQSIFAFISVPHVNNLIMFDSYENDK